METNFSVEFCGVNFANPLILSSGVLGVTASSLLNVVRNGAGGVTTKSIWLEEHIGHVNPTMFGTEHYFMNAVGLSDAGFKKAEEETLPDYLAKKPAPLIANIVASSAQDFGLLAEKISALNPDFLEVNISCPNVEDEFGKPFACSRDDAARVTAEVKKRTDKPVIIKLSPNVSSISEIALACAAAGADAFCAINTLGPGLGINLEFRKPILANKFGGISGPAIKPLALKMVYDVRKATGLPIIGTGGVMNGEDALEMLMAGASLVGMGTMVYYRGVEGFARVLEEMNFWCLKNGVKNVAEIVGTI